MRTDLVNFSAPWTTRWPMAWRSSQPWTPWILVVGSSIQALIRMMAARWSRTGSTPLNGAPAVGLEVDDRFLGPDLLDEALGDTAVAVGLEEIEVGVDDLELDG